MSVQSLFIWTIVFRMSSVLSSHRDSRCFYLVCY